MRLAPTDEQQDLRSTLRRFLADQAPLDRLRRCADTGEGFDRGVWRRLAEEVGVQGVLVLEKYGGLGLGAAETVIVFEEVGRARYDGPLLAAAVAVSALLASGDDATCADVLPRIADGTAVATVAGHGDVSARRQDGRWLLTGSARLVPHGNTADLLLVTAGASLYLVRAADDGVSATALPTLDPAEQRSDVDLRDAPALLVGDEGDAGRVMRTVADRSALAVAAQQAGGIRACLELCVAHARTRTQFGAPIGSFQAVAHKCADMLQKAHFGEAAVRYAGACLDAADPEAAIAVPVAAAYCARSYAEVATETIQVHGGVGFTWEHDAHLYYRHAWSTRQLFGDPAAHHREIADRIGL